jgi:hypothetical protein
VLCQCAVQIKANQFFHIFSPFHMSWFHYKRFTVKNQ